MRGACRHGVHVCIMCIAGSARGVAVVSSAIAALTSGCAAALAKIFPGRRRAVATHAGGSGVAAFDVRVQCLCLDSLRFFNLRVFRAGPIRELNAGALAGRHETFEVRHGHRKFEIHGLHFDGS